MAATTLNPGEEAQLLQTIEMFEVIVQSQPHDCQSLEILKEAYTKLGREADVIRTSKRIAEAYTQMGQLSSAILEYETVLQRHRQYHHRTGRPHADRHHPPPPQNTRGDGRGRGRWPKGHAKNFRGQQA